MAGSEKNAGECMPIRVMLKVAPRMRARNEAMDRRWPTTIIRPLRHRVGLMLALLIALDLAAGVSAQAAQADGKPAFSARAEPEILQSAGAATHTLAIRTGIALHPLTITLPPLAADQMAQAQEARLPGPLQIGQGRSIPGLGGFSETTGLLHWQIASGGGKIAALSIVSPQALGLRMGLLIRKLPAAATLRFYAKGSETAIEVSGQTVLDLIAANRRAGDAGDEAHTYWSPAVEGSESVMEIELPAGIDADNVQIAMPQVSHLFAPIRSSFVIERSSGACNVDVTCQTGWSNESSSVARMIFTSGGSSYLCSGTLLSDKDTASVIPYFLTANHCISSQTAASTLTTYWFYRASACNSGSLFGGSQQLAGGATLLYANAGTDTSFMRLNGSPPAGVVAAGWDSNLPATNLAVTGIHHPGGDLQKINFGTLRSYETCTALRGNTYTCSDTSSASANHYSVTWNSGVTEGGSSGSGLFIANTHYLIGTLHGGESACSARNAPDDYGRFDVAFNAALYQWLNKTDLSVTLAGTGSGTVTSAVPGIACGADCAESYYHGETVTLTATPAGGNTFAGWSGACSGFLNTCTVAMGEARSVTATFSKLSSMVPVLLLLLLE